MLTQRQQLLLRRVVESHVELGRPIGSKQLTGQADVAWSSSTVRYELATLEELGYLNHPHTSAGRVPTDAGYRFYADALLQEGKGGRQSGGLHLELSTMRREVDAAMRATTETLSQVTNLVAAVSAPPMYTATVRHVDVLVLQPKVVLVVVITSTGGVTKRAFTFERAIDPGLADWVASYLKERLVGADLGALTLRGRLAADQLPDAERSFLDVIAPAFSSLAETSEDSVYVEGAARLLTSEGFGDLADANDLLRLLERRVTLLSVLRSALDEPAVYLRIGAENTAPELHSASVVAASYGVGHRTLGAVSVIGPVRMDYAQAIDSVREAAALLSRFVEDVYE
jgi:heat-inducible transcriptional repressor